MSELPGEACARWRVRAGYPLVVLYAWRAQPKPLWLAAGAVIALLGLALRAAAAGHLRKHEALATSGPYAFTRNPLYFGSAVLAAGFLVAGRSWIAAAVVTAYFAVFYRAAMRREEQELRTRYATAFQEYAARVPLFWPRLTPAGGERVPKPACRPPAARLPHGQGRAGTGRLRDSGEFSWQVYWRNREYQAALGTAFGLAVLAAKMLWRG
jgi:hypothetical protein